MKLIIYTLAAFSFLSSVRSVPTPFSSVEFSAADNTSCIPVRELYKSLSLQEIPTTFQDGMVLSLSNETRYGYQFSRTPDRLLRVFKSPFGSVLKPLLGKWINETEAFHHWGIMVSTEPPYNDTSREVRKGKKVPRPETGTIFELRNSGNTGLIYLDVKKWQNYGTRAEKVKYLGKLNKSDIELVNIGRAYIKEVGREGFHNFYRNCQVFTSWYSRALWPRTPLGTRADQLFGKMLWWFKDWKKTAKYGWDKFVNLLGFKKPVEEVDEEAQFVPPEILLQERWEKVDEARNENWERGVGKNEDETRVNRSIRY